MSYRPNEVARGLCRKGFEQLSGDHVRFVLARLDGRRTAVFTRFSHSDREIDDRRFAQISRQLHLPREEAHALIDCRLSREAYEQRLIETGVLSP